MRHYADRIAVIDDLANRPHDCDILLDQNLYDQTQKRYINLVPPACRLFLGPQYALLRNEFYPVRAALPPRTGQIRSVLIFFGGSDLTNETEKTLTALQMLNLGGIRIDVVVGRNNRYIDRIRDICSAMPKTTLHCQTNNMAELMAAADVAIGAGGTTTWERCFLGLPSLTVIVADNQREVTEMAAKAGVTVNLGLSSHVTAKNIAQALQGALDDPGRMCRMSANAMKIMGTYAPPEQHPLVRQILEEKHA
ncbi:pseudaminic acid biosynthesis-associated protein PseG [Acetonema longum DSM 6540]|uniref:Pseudaminic acid biosynthesis-associated protein PseG n=2 Tax=Acetonema TaxID=2373 RepID=F7NNV5_9FIRM|nr:pseudaminic acid biosynthesis-associated protein PseG [Acetonema longum DSM 6540]